jgi:cell division protein FtsI (penicillin-binding protein 3)
MRWVVLAFFLVLSARAAHLTVVTERGELRAQGQLESALTLPATRGVIVDRNGIELALSVRAPSIYVLPREFDASRANVIQLAKALGHRASALRKRLSKRDRFTFIARWVGEDIAARVEALDLPGVGIVMEPRRAYPADELASSLLGFSNIDGQGARGIEQMEDSWLRGKPVRVSVQRDAKGRLLTDKRVEPEMTSGGDVALTIDMTMQAEAETALRAAVEKTGAIGGCVITLDPATGEILALAEAPGFNPNLFRETPYELTRSAAFQDAVEPGSVMKAFLIAAALETGTIHPRQRFDTGDGTIDIPGKKIRDHRPYGVLDPAGTLQHSSNVASVMIAQLLGPEAHDDALRAFGFGSTTGSGFPSESNGLMRPWQDWKAIDHATVAFGQGIGVTSVQLASAMAVLAGDGQWRTPRIVSARRRTDHAAKQAEWQRVSPPAPRRVVSEETADRVMKMLESVVSAEGTGRKAALEGLAVAGKTGTAQKLDRERGVYSKTRYTAWFMGAAPANDPKLVVVAMLDEPKGLAHGGGDVAAPLFARVAAGQLAHVGIFTRPAPIPAQPRSVQLAAEKPEPAKTKAKMIEKTKSAPAREASAAPVQRVAMNPPPRVRSVDALPKAQPATPKKSARKVQPDAQTKLPHVSAGPPLFVPDFRGETVASVRAMAAREKIQLEVRGEGLAIEQQPAPGTIVVHSRRNVWVAFSSEAR